MRAKSIGGIMPCTIPLLRNMWMNGCERNACGSACGNTCGNAHRSACRNTRCWFRCSCALAEGSIWRGCVTVIMWMMSILSILSAWPIWITLLTRMTLRCARSAPFYRFPTILIDSSFKTSVYAFNRSKNCGRKFWVPDVLPQRVHQLDLLKNGTHSTSVVINCLSLYSAQFFIRHVFHFCLKRKSFP